MSLLLKWNLEVLKNQGEVIGVDPDDAEVGVVGVVSGHILQDLQELVAIWEQKTEGDTYRAHGGPVVGMDPLVR